MQYLGNFFFVFQFGSGERNTHGSIWVMKGYGVAESWIKQYTIDIQGAWRTTGLRNNGEMLLATIGGKLVSYHPDPNKLRIFGICGDNGYSFYVGTYIESLVLFKAVNRVLGGQVESPHRDTSI